MDQEPTHKNRAWLEDGILYTEHNGVVTIDVVLKLSGDCLELLNRNKLILAPLVMIFSETADTSQMNITHLHKIVNTELLPHLSVVVIVGMEHANKTLINLASKVFLGGKIQSRDTIEEARALAQTYKSETLPMLEQ